MTEQSQEKTIDLAPNWKNHVLGYGFSILLIPVFGIGLVGLYWVRRQQKKYSYTFSDTRISSRDDKYQRNIDLVNIDKVEVEQSWIQKKMGIGNIVLNTSASSMTLRGMKNPNNLKELLDKAISAEKKRHQQKQKTKPEDPGRDPGTMERMDYLMGLWQQGLVSDEDFKKEREHFE